MTPTQLVNNERHTDSSQEQSTQENGKVDSVMALGSKFGLMGPSMWVNGVTTELMAKESSST